MEGVIATWYTRNTGRDRSRFEDTADELARRLPPGARVLEVAPGPGYLAIELARRGYAVTALDISQSFVRIARENAARAGVHVDVHHGDAAHMPFADESFDYVVCVAAFKNFTDPAGAIDEMHRVVRPGGQASIFDLRKDATPGEIDAEVANMHLPRLSRQLTRWTFRFMLLKLAYTRDQLATMAGRSRFGRGNIAVHGIGCELRMTRSTRTNAEEVMLHTEERTGSGISPADQAAIHDLLRRMREAWANGDGAAYGAVFAEDARYVNAPGQRVVGRRAIAESHQKIFDTFLKHTRIGRGYPLDLQVLTPDVVLVHASGAVLFAGETEDDVAPNGLMTMTVVRRDNDWIIASFNNTQTGKGRNLKFLLRYIRSRGRELVREVAKARRHMLEEKRQNIEKWNR
jgi:uncharacterized protein (TIGR02246 family)